jgi:NACHT conflict system protein/NACHT domain-containing protein
LEVAAGKIGQAVAEHAAKAWLAKRAKVKQRTSSLAELAAAELPKPTRLLHLVEGISHQVGDQLEPVLAAKFSSLPANEVEAALNAVVDCLGCIDLSDDALLAANADPEVLARRVRAEVPVDSELSELAGRLYDVALDQACRYLIQVIRHLPAFQPRALAEVLGRASAQTAQLDDVLSRLPRTSLLAPQGVDNDDEFREEYLRHLTATLDRVELLGLTMRNRPKLALSVAYLSLTVAGDGDGGRTRVEAALTDRTLVRGEAGSGKTTLLDWLAITAARGGFTDDLRSWNGFVALPIRLRAYAESPLPRPEQFLDKSAGTIAGLMPVGWVHRVLKSGRALLMVDGVDEVPTTKRHRVREWLQELVATFPLAKIVVTARPAAAADGWLAEQGFTSVLLEQMDPEDVRTFLTRWHEAARDAESLPCPVAALPAAQRRLMSQLDSRQHLRALASNPLLCAMLCALNLGRTSELPHNRMELYRAALAMLLELRDAERDIVGLLTVTEKTVLLRDLAWRLTLGNRSQLPTAKVREHVERKVRSMPNTTVEPDTIVTHLLERSGVLREPVHGQVDFVHRTFQEYLAADEAVQDGQIETLVGHAHQDSWWQTVVMAAGHAQRSQVGELLTGILDRADAERSKARKLRLVAAACLETVTDVDAAVHERVEQVIADRLVPPRSVEETNSLATIGHRVLRYLPSDLSLLSDASAAGVVRTTGLTGTPEAIARLAAYATDPREAVQRQLTETWRYFDHERYAREVLALSPAHFIMVDSTFQLPLLHLLPKVVKTGISSFESHSSVDFLTDVPHLTYVASPMTGVIDLSPLAEQQELEYLYLYRAERFTNLEALSGLANLAKLNLVQIEDFVDLKFLRGLSGLRFLALRCLAPDSDLTPIAELPALSVCDVYARNSPLDLRPFRGKSLRLHVAMNEEHLGLDELGPGVDVWWY